MHNKKIQPILMFHAYTKKFLIVCVVLCTLFSLYVYTVPKVELASLFFDRYHVIYNIHIAEFFLNQAIIFDSKNDIPPAYAYYQLARISFIQGNLNTALKQLDTEALHYPNHSKVFYIRGLTLGYLGRDSEAVESFREYIRQNGNSWAGRNDMAWLLFKQGKFKEALAVIQPAYEKNPDNPWVLNTYGTLLMNTGDLFTAHDILVQGYNASLLVTEDGWGLAYPGNNPAIYGQGLEGMRSSFLKNLQLVEQKLQAKGTPLY